MSKFLLLLFSLFSLSLSGQGDICNIVYEINKQPERIQGYSQIESYNYEIGFGEEANIDTTLIDKDGSILSLMLMSKSITKYTNDGDINYQISMNTGDTLFTTTSYNQLGKPIFQHFKYGHSQADEIFNSTRSLSYDDHGRVTSIIKRDMNMEQKGYIEVSYDEDNLPITLESNFGAGEIIVRRENKDDHIKYNLNSSMSKEFSKLLIELGKTDELMPLAYVELRKKEDLYESRFFIENDKDSISLQSIIVRDVLGDIHEIIEYSFNIKIKHKKYVYHERKLMEVIDILEEKYFKIEYNENGNPLTEYNDHSTATMEYNEDGMLTTKSTSRIYHDGITEFEVRKYYR